MYRVGELKASRALKKEDQVYGQKLDGMLKRETRMDKIKDTEGGLSWD